MARVSNVAPHGVFQPTGRVNPDNALIRRSREEAKLAFQLAQSAPDSQKEMAVKSLAQKLRDLATELETKCLPPKQPTL